MFKTRLISGVILVAVVIVCTLLGGPVLHAVVGIISIMGMKELYDAGGVTGTGIAAAGFAGAVLYEFVLFWGKGGGLPAAAVCVLLVMAVYVFTFPRYKAEQVFWVIGGFAYVCILMSYLFQVRDMDNGLYILPMVFLSAWGNDTCAYCAGMLFGKHKMAPVLSPKKSIEGFIGGIVGAGILGLLYGLLFSRDMKTLGMTAPECMIICAAAGAISVIGDLCASAVKRDKGIKDYSNVIPGHGGILDRFDSILFTAPVVYILAKLLFR